MLDAPALPPEMLQAKRLLHVVGAAVLDESGRCLVARKAPHVSNAGFWEFPGGKVEEGEDPRRALEREIAEELGLEISAGDFLGRGQAPLPSGRIVVLDVYLAACPAPAPPAPRLADHDEVRWIAAGEIAGLAFAAADVPVLPALERVLSGPAPRC